MKGIKRDLETRKLSQFLFGSAVSLFICIPGKSSSVLPRIREVTSRECIGVFLNLSFSFLADGMHPFLALDRPYFYRHQK
jgi:hypothetical protein